MDDVVATGGKFILIKESPVRGIHIATNHKCTKEYDAIGGGRSTLL